MDARWVATAAFGLEAVVRRELEALGLDVEATENGRVLFGGGPAAMMKANLWSRCADRILLEAGSFPARTFDALFEGTRALPWEDWIDPTGEFPVEGKSVRSVLASVPDCQRIVKKAIATRLQETSGQSWMPETGGRYRVQVALLKDQATLTIDTSGPGLHKRGYRDQSSVAPLKETLAAALVGLSFWAPDRPFADLFCGSGTIVIEAAMAGMSMAPGLNRGFAFEGWPGTDPAVWQQIRNEAIDRVDWDATLDILGSDRDPAVLEMARHHVRRAGVEDQVRLLECDFGQAPRPEPYGCMVCNPPYGERMGEEEEAEALYRRMGELFRQAPTWSHYVISSHPGFERLVGRTADRRRKLYNGRIQCNYYQFHGPRPGGPPRGPAPERSGP